MDTVTRSAMAIVQAEEGGIGIIDRGFRSGDISAQVREVEIVKRTQHGTIPDPYTVPVTSPLFEAAAKMEKSGVGTLVVVDGDRKLRGLLTQRDVRFADRRRDAGLKVSDRMTPLDQLVFHVGQASLDEAERIMLERKVKKLPLVDQSGVLLGLITAKDIIKQKRMPFATRDDQGRLRVGAAIGAKGDFLERAAELIRVGVDVIVIDIAHGHSAVMARAIEQFRKQFGDVELIAGNVATSEGACFLAERGVNGVKVGIGPGGGCTTRLNTNFGVPQVQAIVGCAMALERHGIPMIADGGIRRDGALLEALLFGGDTVMLGNVFAGTIETPGETVHKSVRAAGVAENGQGGVQSLPRHGVHWRDRRSARRGRRRRARSRDAWRRRIGSVGAGPRLGARDHAGPGEASLLGHQLRRRAQPRGAQAAVLETARAVFDSVVRGGAAGILRSLKEVLKSKSIAEDAETAEAAESHI